MNSFYFFFIRVYLIYHVVFQVSSKVIQLYIYMYLGFPLGSVVKESPCNEGDLGSIAGLGRYAERDRMSLSSILAWRISWTESQQATVHRVTKSRAHLNQLSLHRHTYTYLFLYKLFFHICCYRISGRVACGFVVGPCGYLF